MSKIEKKEEVVLGKLEAAVVVDALMIVYGLVIDQIPLDDLVEVLKEHRSKVIMSYKEKLKEDGK